MDKPPRLRVLVVDGVPLTRFALVSLIELHPLYEVCAEAADAPQARQLCAEERPDVVVLDLAVPRGDGMELLREFRKLHSGVRSMVVTDREDALSVQRAFRAGVCAYLTKQDEGCEVLMGLERVLAGELYASPRVSHLMLKHLAQGGRGGNEPDVGTLSDRELQVFRLLGRKLGATAISRELGVSVKTVETHQQRMKAKLGLATGAELQRDARRFHQGGEETSRQS